MTTQHGQSPKFEETLKQIIPSVIAIAVGKTFDGRPNIIGTGFALEISEFFATCSHVASFHDEVIGKSEGELRQV